MTKENPFHKFTASSERQKALQARSDAEYEARLVGFVLKKFHLERVERQLRKRDSREGGAGDLKFRYFCDEYRSFPILLGADPLRGITLHTDSRAFLPALFKNFDKTPFVMAYEEFFEDVADAADSRAVGLVFPRKGIRHGLVIHNGDDLDRAVFHGMVMTYHGGTKKARRNLYVQPFQTLVEALHKEGHGWRPES